MQILDAVGNNLYFYLSRVWNRCLHGFGASGDSLCEFHTGEKEVNVMGVRGLACWRSELEGRRMSVPTRFNKSSVFDDAMFVLRLADGTEQATVFPASLQYGFRPAGIENSRDVAPGVHKYHFGVHNSTGASLASQARLATEVKPPKGASQWVDRAAMPLQNGHSLPYRALKPFPTVPGFRDANKNGRPKLLNVMEGRTCR